MAEGLPSRTTLLYFTARFATSCGEEFDFEALDAVFELGAHRRVEAVNEVLLDEADSAGRRFTVVIVAPVNQVEQLVPALRLRVLTNQVLEQGRRHYDLLVEDFVFQNVAHLENFALVLVCLELEHRLCDLFADVLVEPEDAVVLDDLMEDLAVLFDLRLRRENPEARELVVDRGFELFSLLLAVNDLRELVRLLVEQVLDQAVVKVALEGLYRFRFPVCVPVLRRSVQL